MAPTVPRGPGATGSILVVDDDAFIARLLELELASAGHDVRTAGSGAEALELVGERVPDLVLADVMMPGMDGFELTRRLRADPDTRSVTVVLVTALGLAADRSRGLEAGADDYVVKPFDVVDLLARIDLLLRCQPVARATPRAS